MQVSRNVKGDEPAQCPADTGQDRLNLGSTSVVIVNFNAGEYLNAAVESVLAQEMPAEVIIVDNNSSDDSLRSLRETKLGSRVRLIELDANHGFARACNIGIAEARGDNILLLNPDCQMAPGALAAMSEALNSNPTFGMAGPLLVNPDGTEQRGGRRDIPNPWQIFCVTLQLHRVMSRHPRFRTFNLHEQALPDEPVEVQAISGACMLVKRSAVDKVGTMDGDYFLHFEDLDWCLRFAKAGFGIVFAPAASVTHTRGVCGRDRIRRVEYYKHRSLIRFLHKNFTQFYPSSFMALVTFEVILRLIAVLAASLFIRRPFNRAPWEWWARWTANGNPDGRDDWRK